MALFPNVESDYTFGGRTHTNLIVSEGAAPAEKWIVSKGEAVKFSYEFGPEGNQNVVLAKGKLVELDAPEYDYETGREISSIKTATEGSKRAVGVNHHNIYERRRDRFSGNNQPNPVVVTRSYIEVPLFEHADVNTASNMAAAMHYGAAYGSNGADIIKPGDFVKVGKSGNFEKLNVEEDSAFQIVGQALAVERELPPAGFLQYYMDMEIPEIEAFMKARSTTPSPGSNGVDAGAYPYGHPYSHRGWVSDFEKLLNPTINKGIPFLTDGYFKAKQTVPGIALNDIYDVTNNNDGHVEAVDFSGGVTFGHDVAGTFTPSTDNAVDAGVKTAADTRNNAVFIKLRHKIDAAEANPIVVKADGVAVAGADVHIDYTNNTVVVYLEPNQTVKALTIDAKLVVDPVAGVPTEWDYAGAVGAVRILLQR